MAIDLNFNGTSFPDRTGNDKYGTFFTTVQPAALSGYEAGQLQQRWGSRIAEISSRGRGLSGIGTVPSLGTLTITFPANYFSFIPIIEFNQLINTKLFNFGKQRTDASIKAQQYIIPNEMSFYYSTDNPTEDNFFALSTGLLLRQVQITGFKVAHVSPDAVYGVGGGPEPNYGQVSIIYWHARGC